MVIKCYFKYICLASRKSYYSTPPFLPSPPTPHYPSPRTTTPPAPLPKGAGLRQGSLVSNTTIIRDTCNAQILQTLSAVKTEGSPPPTFPLLPSPPLTIPQKLAEFSSATEAHLYTREPSMILLFHNLHFTQNLYKTQHHSKKKQHAPPRTTQKSKFAPSAQPQLFIIHYSLFIIHYTAPHKKTEQTLARSA